MLLHSCPDTVRKLPLCKTQTSTPLIPGCFAKRTPSAEHHPCYSGLQVQGTAISPAARKFETYLSAAVPFRAQQLMYYILSNRFCQGLPVTLLICLTGDQSVMLFPPRFNVADAFIPERADTDVILLKASHSESRFAAMADRLPIFDSLLPSSRNILSPERPVIVGRDAIPL